MNSGPKWSLRNGAQYRRLCARPGCGAAAVATLRFQSTQRQAWLVELDDSAARTQGDLCQRHAAALVLPRGWELHDERPFAAAGTAAPPREPTPVEARTAVDVVEPAAVVEAFAVVEDVAALDQVADVEEIEVVVLVEEIVDAAITDEAVVEEAAEADEPEPEREPEPVNGNGAG